MLDPGDAIPDLPISRARDGDGRLSDYAGRWLVLYFYPKDNTPGCTTEGLDFNALLAQFRERDAEVVGVSRDSLKSHGNFRDKHALAFDLIADGDETLCRAFGVIKEKSLYGRKYMGVERSTFLIDPTCVIRAAWRPVKVKGHAEAVLAALDAARQ